MPDEDNGPLHQLQASVAVGERHGLELLMKTGGDVAQAAQLFKEAMLAQAVAKTGASSEMAARHLATHCFNLGEALKSIDTE